MKKRTVRNVSLIIFILIFGAFLLYQFDIIGAKKSDLSAGGEATAQPVANTQAAGTPVRAMVVRSNQLRNVINVNGSTVPNEEVVVTSERPGKVVEIRFKEGSVVQKGDVLVKLDDEELQAQRKKLLVQQDLAEKISERLQKLYEKEGVSLQEYEVAEAEVNQYAADIALLDAQLEKTLVRSPFSGVLGLRQVSLGSYVSPGTPIVSLVSIQPIKLEFSVPERYSAAVHTGTKVNFTLDGVNGNFQATVEAREPNINADTRTLTYKASAPNPGGRILPGAFANVEVNLEEFDAAILVPTQAIVPEVDGKRVYLYKNGKAESVMVETGIRQNELVQVTEGVQVGDTIITSGVLQIRGGSEVSILSLD